MSDSELSGDSTVPDRRRSSGDPFALCAGDTVDRYEIQGRIGSGGMGVVYRARDPTLGREIALKLVRADLLAEGEMSRARLLREARAMAQVSHPNVLPIYDVGTAGTDVFIAMELVKGRSLPAWCRERPRSPEQIVDVFIEAGQGLVAVHAAGLIHRDFKPSNVLLDHRVLIMDFGLARATGSPTELDRSASGASVVRSDAHPLSAQLTQASTVLGTPAYMAPEQMLIDQQVDPRCDQYAFCVALFEVLFGHRPVPDGTMTELYRAKMDERWVEVEPSGGLSRRMVPILQRGMAARPDDRWPSMAALVAELQQVRAPSRWRRWLPWAAVTLALGGLGVTLALRDAPASCGAQDPLAGIWDDDQRRAVHEAWEASAVPYREPVWAKVEPRLDAYAEAWRAQHRAVCEANRRAEVDEPAQLDRRSQCLDDRRRHLAALVHTLGRSEPAVVEAAVASVAALPPIGRCEDARLLASTVEPPQDPGEAASAAELRQDLANARALTEAGLYDEAFARLHEVNRAAEALGYAPLQASAAVALGRLMLRRGDREGVAEALTRGYFVAREQGQDELALAAAIGLIEQSNVDNRFEDGMQWSRTAEALLLALGDPPAQRASVLEKTGALLSEVGEDRRAIEQLERALRLERGAPGGADPRVARTQLSLGTALRREGRVDRAVEALGRALATAEAAYDPTHPAVSKFHNNLGNALVMAGRLDEALDHYEQAEQIHLAAYGDDDPERAGYLISRSQVHLARSELNRAEALTLEVLSIWEDAHGTEHPMVALALNNLGVICERRHDDAGAAAHYRRSLRISQQALGSTHPNVVVLHRNLGEALLDLEQREEAREQFEQVLTIAEDHEIGADDLAMARFGLARLSWDDGVDRAAARALAERAHAEMTELGAPVAKEVEQITAWLAAHELEATP